MKINWKTVSKIIVAAFTVCFLFLLYIVYPPEAKKVDWPDGKKFAFTIVDDTDLSTLERLKPLYDVMAAHKLRTTKTIWVLEGTELEHITNNGVSLSDPEYIRFLRDIRQKGFEIALHSVRGGSSERQDIVKGLELYKQEFQSYPYLHINHSLNKDNLYWGERRFEFWPFQLAFSILKPYQSFGSQSNSNYFWGDLAKEHIKYVRRFTYPEINLLKVNPYFPYTLESKPYVNYWFPNSDGDNLDQFEKLLSKENLDQLEQEGGLTMVYCHLGAGSFNNEEDNSPKERFVNRIKDLSARNGWFAPASEILDFLQKQPGWTGELSLRDRLRIELLFFYQRVRKQFE